MSAHDSAHTKSTLGPWVITVDAGVHQINDAAGEWVCECGPEAAPLISAAPDLAEALQELIHVCRFATFDNGVTDATGTMNEGDVWASRALDAAAAALRKANGG